jgi:23S rRNA (pseudouridine1915-N3)-methyltransferase
MLSIRVIVVDKTRSPFLKRGESFYLDRLRRYAHLEWVPVKPAKIMKGSPAYKVLAQEGESISRRLLPRDYIIALDRTGKSYESNGFARRIQELSVTQPRLSFIIGGVIGLSTDLLNAADEILSLSRFTLTHEMSRLLLLEQLYRAFTIINNEKYHK